MIPEEARKIIKQFRDRQGNSSDDIEALDMAIKELDQQPCEDCISREALLEELGEEPFNWNDSPEEFQEVRDYQWFKSLVENAPSVAPETRWVPVSERLPKEGMAVLVWCPERKNIYCACYEEKQWWIFGAYFKKIELDVIAWMPLPEPYVDDKEVADDE